MEGSHIQKTPIQASPSADSSGGPADPATWRELVWKPAVARQPERRPAFVSPSGIPLAPLYGTSPEGGMPGSYPFTRGIRPSMYRGRLWTMRQYAGFSSARQTNERFKLLLENGQTGLSTAFDLPTQIGYDSDHPLALPEVGQVGVPINSLSDVERLFDGIPLGEVSTSMTINATASILLAMYVVLGRRQGVASDRLRGTVQNDILKEYAARGNYRFPVGPSLRLTTDMMAFCAEEVPNFNTISISGYHIREAGSTAAQELAFTLKNGFTYVEKGIERGLDVDAFAPRLSFFWDVHNDFFEEIAKFRAARRIWARHMRDIYGARDPASWRLRTHAQTAGVTLTAQQPHNNIVRVAYQGLAAVLGGTQSLHTNAMDETLALPTEESARIALRTQQILAYETGVPNTIDPLAGSYFLESLTDELEAEAEAIFEEVDALGGVVAGIHSGYFQAQIATSSRRFQEEVETGQRPIVGVNVFVESEEEPIEILKIGEEAAAKQDVRLARLRAARDDARVAETLDRLREAAERDENLMPPMLDAVREYATLGEIRETLVAVYGHFKEPVAF